MERRKLSAAEIEANLAGLNDWTVANDKLSKKFEFENFAESLSFVNKVGEIAERLGDEDSGPPRVSPSAS